MKQNHHTLIKLSSRIIFIFFIYLANMPIIISAQQLSKKDTSDVHFLNSRKFYIYKVDKGETLFSISQKFKIPQEEILEFNHDIGKEGLKAKMKLWIPAYSWLKKDTVTEKIVEEVKMEKSVYKIAVVTCLNLPRIYTTVDTSASYVEEALKKELKENLEFTEGLIHSAEILKGDGLKIHLYIIDSENDSINLLRKLKRNTDYNLVITNETGGILKCISGFTQEREIKLFSSSLNAIDIIGGNKYAFSLLPSSGAQCEQIGKFSEKYFLNAVPITIKTISSKENERSEHFRSGWMSCKIVPFKNIDYSKGGSDAVADSLDKMKTNVLFISSSNEDFVSNILLSLKNKIPDYNIRVIGLPTWQYFESIDQKLIEACNVYLFSSGFIDYGIQPVVDFRKYFRDKYNTEPSETAYQGFDALLVAWKIFLKNGNKMFAEDKQTTVKGLYTDYSFIHFQNENAFENEIIHVFQPANDVSADLVKNVKMK